MIRAFRASVQFALAVAAAFVVIEATLAIAHVGGWLRFCAAIAVCAFALFTLPRMLTETIR